MNFSGKRPRYILTVITILVLVFIWGNSLVPRNLSVAVSTHITEFFGGEVVGKEDGMSDIEIKDDDWYFRKACHLTEFLFLGGALTLLLATQKESRREKVLFLSCAGMFVPLVDETIQLFSGRYGVIRDVWIDITGYMIGCLLICGIAAGKRSHRKGKGGAHDGGNGFGR